MKGVWREIRESLDIGRFAGSFRDRWVWLAFLLGGIGLLFPSGGLGFLHAVKLLGGVFQSQMCVGVHRHPYFRMPHEVLQCLGIHAGVGHVLQ